MVPKMLLCCPSSIARHDNVSMESWSKLHAMTADESPKRIVPQQSLLPPFDRASQAASKCTYRLHQRNGRLREYVQASNATAARVKRVDRQVESSDVDTIFKYHLNLLQTISLSSPLRSITRCPNQIRTLRPILWRAEQVQALIWVSTWKDEGWFGRRLEERQV
jgi:hypothetical protein